MHSAKNKNEPMRNIRKTKITSAAMEYDNRFSFVCCIFYTTKLNRVTVWTKRSDNRIRTAFLCAQHIIIAARHLFRSKIIFQKSEMFISPAVGYGYEVTINFPLWLHSNSFKKNSKNQFTQSLCFVSCFFSVVDGHFNFSSSIVPFFFNSPVRRHFSPSLCAAANSQNWINLWAIFTIWG